MGTASLESLKLIDSWPVDDVAAGVIDHHGNLFTRGKHNHSFRLASISKVMTAWAALIAVEDGSVSLDDPVGQPGCTLRHLLCHAGGYGFDTEASIISPERKRVYSNTGYNMAAQYVSEFVDMGFARYLHESLFAPLNMPTAQLLGSPAADIHCTIEDMAKFAQELRRPTVIALSTYIDATTAQFPELEGIVPGLGKYSPCPWGLGPEIRGAKHPHWTAPRNSASTFGHFGGTGTFVWHDPVANVTCFALTNRGFDLWAMQCWPEFGQAVLNELGR